MISTSLWTSLRDLRKFPLSSCVSGEEQPDKEVVCTLYFMNKREKKLWLRQTNLKKHGDYVHCYHSCHLLFACSRQIYSKGLKLGLISSVCLVSNSGRVCHWPVCWDICVPPGQEDRKKSSCGCLSYFEVLDRIVWNLETFFSTSVFFFVVLNII